jgi:putative ABC transport system permease protein
MWRVIAKRDAFDRAMHDEFALHVDLLADDLVRRGVPRDDAMRQARLMFGNVTSAKEDARAAKGLAGLDAVRQDVRFTIRTLRKHIGFTAVAVLSLGFGIGAATTVFSVIDTLDFRPLPYADANRLVSVAEVTPASDPMCARCTSETSLATARDWLAQVRSYDALVVTEQTSFTWEHDDIDESPGAFLTTPGLLELFRLHPAIGRDLAATDTLPGAPPVILLTYDFWNTRFGGDSSVIGAHLRARLVGLTAPVQTVTIVGVLPKDFRIMPQIKVWGATSLAGAKSRTERSATVMARLKPNVSIDGASAELRGLSTRLGRLFPEEYRGWSAGVEPLRDRLEWSAGKGRGALFAVTLAVLLIAVLNVTGLLFARAAARQPEFALRAALGAGRMRLLRQLLVEGSCIGMFGGLLGVGLAFGGVRVAERWFSIRSTGLTLGIDYRVLSFTTLLSLAVGVAAAVAPAIHAARMDAVNSLRPRIAVASRSSRWSNVLIASQIAMALVLLTVATLLSRDFLELRYFDIGYDPHRLFTTSVSAPREQWSKPDPWRIIVAETRDRVADARGIQSASIEYENAMHPAVVRPDIADGLAATRTPRVKAVSPDFFATWKNPILIGRAFATSDAAGAPLVAIVNRACASAFWPGRNPLGRRVFLGDSASVGEWVTVVGVAEDIERADYARRHNPVVYRPFDQAPLYHASAHLYVRLDDHRGDALTSALSTIRRVSGRQSAPFTSDESYLDTRFFARRFNAIALDVFAGFGLLLAAMGIYGSIAVAVTQRTREIGIRVALGATRQSVLGLIARRGLFVAAIGTCFGAAASLALTRVFRSLVSVTSVANPWTLGASAGVVLGIALLATLLPARRATGVNPVIALRAD